jgi:hypothetical protein
VEILYTYLGCSCFFHQDDSELLDECLRILHDPSPEPLDYNLLSPLTLPPITPSFSSHTTAKSSLEEAQSMVVTASVSPALGSEADDYPTGCQSFPAGNSDKTSNTTAPIEYSVNGSNAYAATNQVEDVTAAKVRKELNSSLK